MYNGTFDKKVRGRELPYQRSEVKGRELAYHRLVVESWHITGQRSRAAISEIRGQRWRGAISQIRGRERHITGQRSRAAISEVGGQGLPYRRSEDERFKVRGQMEVEGCNFQGERSNDPARQRLTAVVCDHLP
ncbi:hypothetical protein ACOMHN_061337 [Nucella lapillus]